MSHIGPNNYRYLCSLSPELIQRFESQGLDPPRACKERGLPFADCRSLDVVMTEEKARGGAA